MFLNRLIRTVQLNPEVFLEVARDKSSFVPAMVIMLLSNVAAGIGSVGGHVEKIPMAITFAVAGWIIWVVLIYMIGARLFPGQKTETTSLRAVFSAMGFASAPGLLRFLAYFPPFSVIATLGATIWMFGTILVAAQKVLHYQSLSRTLGVILSGWAIYQWLLITI